MYHRFDENKYPSTNIKTEVFKKHLDEINNSKIELINFKKFEYSILNSIDKNSLLLTIDDGFESFYKNAWPILKKDKIPFILFVSTEAVGRYGYMSWDQIIEISKNDFVTIGNHSHTHDYLVDWEVNDIKNDLKKSIELFKSKIGYSPKIFSYPFGEYSNEMKKIVNDLGFKYAFGQHSGVIDRTKNLLEMPRFPINEKYGDIKRFKSLLNTLPFPYKDITPENRYLDINENPPKIEITFFEDLININKINCYSNEGNNWGKSNIKFLKNNKIRIVLKDKFKSERGRVNCSLKENDGKWRWLGIQYVIAEY